MGLLGCDRCGRWHLTIRSRRSCFWEHSAVPLNPLGSSATSWDGYWLEQQKRENARDRARLHVPMVPSDPIEAALTQWGNGQLDPIDDVLSGVKPHRYRLLPMSLLAPREPKRRHVPTPLLPIGARWARVPRRSTPAAATCLSRQNGRAR